VKVERVVCHHLFLSECYRREKKECFHGDGPKDEIFQSLDVPSYRFRGGLCRLEHGEDSVPSEIRIGESVGWRGPNVWLPLRPNVGGVL
jgi:hypothetical protein